MSMPRLLRNLQLIAPLLIIGCTENKNIITPEKVAIVNGVTITRQELVSRLELSLLPEFDKLKGRNRRVLDILIDELVVSQWAEREGLTALPDYQDALDFVKQQALIRELFFEKFRKRAEPDSEQINQAIQKSIQQLSIQTLFTENQAIAEKWSQSIDSGKTFNELVEESTNNPFIHLNNSSFHWGDGTVPLEIENIAYQLKLGESSDLLQLNNVFLIFIIKSKMKDAILTEYSYSLKRQTVKIVLQARTESRLANEYVDRLLTHLKITQRATGFLEVSRYIEGKLSDSSEKLVSHTPVIGEEIHFSLDYNLELPVVETPDFTWTGKDVMKIIRRYNYTFKTKSSEDLRNTLTRFLKAAVRDHYLSERAKQLGLESKKRVKKDTQAWARYFLYLKGVTIFTERDTALTNPGMIADRIMELRRDANITINHNLLETIELTGIPMLVFWNSDIARQLAVPPLMEFR